MVVEDLKENRLFLSDQRSYQPLLAFNTHLQSTYTAVVRFLEKGSGNLGAAVSSSEVMGLSLRRSLPLNSGGGQASASLGKRHGLLFRLIMSMGHDSLSCNIFSSSWDKKKKALSLLDPSAFVYSFI